MSLTNNINTIDVNSNSDDDDDLVLISSNISDSGNGNGTDKDKDPIDLISSGNGNGGGNNRTLRRRTRGPLKRPGSDDQSRERTVFSSSSSDGEEEEEEEDGNEAYHKGGKDNENNDYNEKEDKEEKIMNRASNKRQLRGRRGTTRRAAAMDGNGTVNGKTSSNDNEFDMEDVDDDNNAAGSATNRVRKRRQLQPISYKENDIEDEDADEEEEDDGLIYENGNSDVGTGNSRPTPEKEEKAIDKLLTNLEGAKQEDDHEQKQFDQLDDKNKLERLHQLVEKSKIFSQIIADTLLESTLQKKKKEKEEQEEREREEREKEEKERKATMKAANGEAVGGKATANHQNEDVNDLEGDDDKIVVPNFRRSRRLHRKKKKSNDFLSIYNSSKKQEISEETKQTKKKLADVNSGSRTQPKLVTGAVMRDYQLDGLEWLVTLYENGLNGILADEMGLGKTLQSISLLAFLYENGNKGPFLIACPLSTVGNWINEIEKFAPTMPHLRYVGSKEDRKAIRKKYFTKWNRSRVGIVVTSYEMILKDRQYLNRFKWKFLIVDEGHRLKNINSKLIKELKKLDTTNRLLLTGTPLQNNLDELWSLLNFILPDIFQDIDLFHKWFDFSQLGGSDNSELINAEIQKSLIENLHTILKPFLLRRLKKTVVKSLPPKREYIVYNALSKVQREMYEAALSHQLKPFLLETAFREYLEVNSLDRYYTTEQIDHVIKVKLNAKKTSLLNTAVDVIDLNEDIDSNGQLSDAKVGPRKLRAKGRGQINYKESNFYPDANDLSYSESDLEALEDDADEIGQKKAKKDENVRKSWKQIQEGTVFDYDNGNQKGVYLSTLEQAAEASKRKHRYDQTLNFLDMYNVDETVINQLNKINHQINSFDEIMQDLKIFELQPLSKTRGKRKSVIKPASKLSQGKRTKVPHINIKHPISENFQHPYTMRIYTKALMPDSKGQLLPLLPPPQVLEKLCETPVEVPREEFIHLKKQREQLQKVLENEPDNIDCKKALNAVNRSIINSTIWRKFCEAYNETAENDYETYKQIHSQMLAEMGNGGNKQEDNTAFANASATDINGKLTNVGSEKQTNGHEVEGQQKRNANNVAAAAVLSPTYNLSDKQTKKQSNIISLVSCASKAITNSFKESTKNSNFGNSDDAGGATKENTNNLANSDAIEDEPKAIKEMVNGELVDSIPLLDSDVEKDPKDDGDSKDNRDSKTISTENKGGDNTKEASKNTENTNADNGNEKESEDGDDNGENDGKEDSADKDVTVQTSVAPIDSGAPSLDHFWNYISNAIEAKKLHNLMMQLRLICDSPYLFYFPWEHQADIDNRLVKNSGKMQMLEQITDQLFEKEKRDNHKLLIFSQFTKMLDLIEDWAEYKQIKCSRIDGNVGQEDREEEIYSFNNDPKHKIFLLSTRAGGLGINLVAADTVILFDSDWNPQVDLQAMDRVHRLGQTRPVVVYRFATANTAEQILLSRADSKRKLEKVVIQMGKFESLKKFAGEKRANAATGSTVTEDLSRLLKENTFQGQQITDNKLSDEEIKELMDRRPEAYKKSSCILHHVELFETSTELQVAEEPEKVEEDNEMEKRESEESNNG